MGNKDNDAAEKILVKCFVVQVIISLIRTAVIILWNREFLMAFGESQNTIEYGVNYMNI